MAMKKKAAKGAARKPAPRKTKPAAKARIAPGALKMSEASPSFTVDDLEKSLAWYRDVLGFSVGEEWEHEGKRIGAELRAGGVTFMIGQDDWKKGRDRRKGEAFRIYCTTTQDVDVLAEGIQARGGTLDDPPRDTPWGTRDFTLTDPDGFKITIGRDSKKR